MIDLPPAEVRCLETAIHYEAKGESVAGKIAVGNVVLNRVASGKYPRSVCEVVKQKKQFSWYQGNDEKFNSATSASTKFAAQKAMQAKRNDVLFFHAKYVMPGWSKSLSKQFTIGNHIFYAIK